LAWTVNAACLAWLALELLVRKLNLVKDRPLLVFGSGLIVASPMGIVPSLSTLVVGTREELLRAVFKESHLIVMLVGLGAVMLFGDQLILRKSERIGKAGHGLSRPPATLLEKFGLSSVSLLAILLVLVLAIGTTVVAAAVPPPKNPTLAFIDYAPPAQAIESSFTYEGREVVRYSIDPGANQAVGISALSDGLFPEWRKDLLPPNQGNDLISRCVTWLYDPSPEGIVGSEFVELHFRGLNAGRSKFVLELTSVELRYFLSVHPRATGTLKVFNSSNVCVLSTEITFSEDAKRRESFETSGGQSSIRKLVSTTEPIDIAEGWTVALQLQMGVRDDNLSLKRMMALGEVTVRTGE